jgi:6-phosphogluconolactonase
VADSNRTGNTHEDQSVNTRAIRVIIAVSFLAKQGKAGATQGRSEYFLYVGTANHTGRRTSDIYACRFSTATGKLVSLGIAGKATNPGFLALHPNRQSLYASNEIDDYKGLKSGAVSAFRIDKGTGRLTLLNEVASGGPNPAYVTVDRSGQFLLAANYYGETVKVFPLLENGRLGEASDTGHLVGSSVNSERQEGPHPHSVEMSPDNHFVIVADLGVDKLLVYRFDSTKGSLTPNNPPFVSFNPGAGPRHVVFAPNRKFLYVINELQSSIAAFSYDSPTGRLNSLQTISTVPSTFKDRNTAAAVQVSDSGQFLYASNRGHDSIAVFAIDHEAGTLVNIDFTSTRGKTPRAFVIDPTGSFLLVANQDSNQIAVFRIGSENGRLEPTEQGVGADSPVHLVLASIE